MRQPSRVLLVGVCLALLLTQFAAAASPVTKWEVTPTSLISRDEPVRQRIDLTVECKEAVSNGTLRVFGGERLLAEQPVGALQAGTNHVSVLLAEPTQAVETRWVLLDGANALAEQRLTWKPPRHWTLYVLKSSHVDIGLHDPQYKQRLLTVECVDQARKLAEQTADWPQASRFRYVVEGLWWWLNYPQDRSEQAADEVVEKLVGQRLFDIGASHSGNHTQVYGMEELCRSTYYLRELRKRWNVSGETMLMVDNNGISWPLVTAFADAGVKNLIFLPNAWNPDVRKEFVGWGSGGVRDHLGGLEEAGGSRIDVGWKSPLPHLFYWQGPDKKSRLLVWTNPTYTNAGHDFGIHAKTPELAESKMVAQLAKLTPRYPYDTWLISLYHDNEKPSLEYPSFAKEWNARWRWPELRTVGDLSEPFRKVEERFGDQIPTLRGAITGGWAQHPLSTPALLGQKRAADRLLPVAETLSTLARLVDRDFVYPTLALRRAWDALICNDEHGYGVSYYKGRPVYDTWMQKRDWIERGLRTAETESKRALDALAKLVPAAGPSVFVFNPTLQPRCATVDVELPASIAHLQSVQNADGKRAPSVATENGLRFRTSPIPALGYAVFELAEGAAPQSQRHPSEKPPTVENDFYRLTFAADGSIAEIFDKQLKRQLIDAAAAYRCNQLVYTRDTHKTFSSPGNARFEIESSPLEQTVIARMDDAVTGAAIEQRVTLPNGDKRIEIDNRLEHVRDLGEKDRWHRFGYYAFPIDVPHGEFRLGLNGCTAKPYLDQTGHGTDAYHAPRDWSYVGNSEFGVVLVQLDSQLIECGSIHDKKNAFGEQPSSSHLYSAIFNDWLYAHAWVTGPSHINLRYRYTIISQQGAFATANAAQLAEHAVTPVLATVLPQAQIGQLPALHHSFLTVNAPNVSLLTLKLSETPGRGVVARFHETDGRETKVALDVGWGENPRVTRCSLIEEDQTVLSGRAFGLEPFGYATLRMEQSGTPPTAPKLAVRQCTDNTISLTWKAVDGACQYYVYRGESADFAPDAYHLLAVTKQTACIDDSRSPGDKNYYRVAAVTDDVRQGAVSAPVLAATRSAGSSPPARVGSGYTGLITDPRAWRGDEPDILYLQWGQNRDADLAYYEVYRGETPDFELNENSLAAKVEPGPYVVVPYEDKGLKPHAVYYYRVRAVDRDGNRGAPSDVCRGVTREM